MTDDDQTIITPSRPMRPEDYGTPDGNPGAAIAAAIITLALILLVALAVQ